MKLATVFVCALALAAPAAFAQSWEFGGGVGAGFYTKQDVTNQDDSVDAKFDTNLSGNVWVGNNNAGKWGGELRYSYQRGDAQLEGLSQSTSFGAESHTVVYDLLWHGTERGSDVRPYVAVGGGVKLYRGTGEEVLVRPLERFALLTKSSGIYGVVSVGAGVKVKLSPRWQFRVDVHDYISPFPKKVIQPAAGSDVSGWIHDIVPMVGIAYTSDN